jgi:hypothetical protein
LKIAQKKGLSQSLVADHLGTGFSYGQGLEKARLSRQLGSLNSMAANLPMRRSTKPALPATGLFSPRFCLHPLRAMSAIRTKEKEQWT